MLRTPSFVLGHKKKTQRIDENVAETGRSGTRRQAARRLVAARSRSNAAIRGAPERSVRRRVFLRERRVRLLVDLRFA